MSSEERVKAEPCAGTATARERKTKRRAVALSIALQTAGLAALVIAPLFAKPTELVERVATPIPPYSHSAAPNDNVRRPEHPHGHVCLVCPTAPIRPVTAETIRDESHISTSDPIIGGVPGNGESTNLIKGIDNRPPPVRPDDPPHLKKPLVVGHIDPALLTRRVEPVFPALARQLHRSGKVELRAIIGTDGTVQALEVVSGDPLFINSAREAVLQWRYKPTYLNGEPVEIDTFITVIYTLQ